MNAGDYPFNTYYPETGVNNGSLALGPSKKFTDNPAYLKFCLECILKEGVSILRSIKSRLISELNSSTDKDVARKELQILSRYCSFIKSTFEEKMLFTPYINYGLSAPSKAGSAKQLMTLIDKLVKETFFCSLEPQSTLLLLAQNDTQSSFNLFPREINNVIVNFYLKSLLNELENRE